MRHALYQNFYEALKQFVEDEEFTIKYEMFGDRYVLAFDKKDKRFYFSEGRRSFPRTKDVYRIIKSYVDDLFTKEQKAIFNGTLIYKEENYNLKFASKSDIPIFLELLNKFEKNLWEEPISIDDIRTKMSLSCLSYGFGDLKVPVWFIQHIIVTFGIYPDKFYKGKLSDLELIPRKDKAEEMELIELKILEEEGYLKIKKDQNKVENYIVIFTEKFYNALKKSFYYYYDPVILLNLK